MSAARPRGNRPFEAISFEEPFAATTRNRARLQPGHIALNYCRPERACGSGATKGESTDPESDSTTMRIQGISTRNLPACLQSCSEPKRQVKTRLARQFCLQGASRCRAFVKLVGYRIHSVGIFRLALGPLRKLRGPSGSLKMTVLRTFADGLAKAKPYYACNVQ
jgi:hypothetical protein